MLPLYHKAIETHSQYTRTPQSVHLCTMQNTNQALSAPTGPQIQVAKKPAVNAHVRDAQPPGTQRSHWNVKPKPTEFSNHCTMHNAGCPPGCQRFHAKAKPRHKEASSLCTYVQDLVPTRFSMFLLALKGASNQCTSVQFHARIRLAAFTLDHKAEAQRNQQSVHMCAMLFAH